MPGDGLPTIAATPKLHGSSKFRMLASAWLPVVFCMGVIATESTAMFGADHTTGPLRQLCEFFLGPISEGVWSNVHFMIRKTGHFMGYGILSAAWFRAFRMTWPLKDYPLRNWLPSHGLALLGTLLVASSDEIHQSFLPNRTGTFHDVMTDCSGAIVMQLAIWLWIRARATESVRKFF